MKHEKITVYLNDKPRTLYLGMRVKDAISTRRVKAIREHRATIRDADGNSIDFDGALYDGERLYLVPIDPITFADEVQKRADRAFR